VRLICFPFAGRGASVFARWGTFMGDVFEVSAVQFPGREARLAEPAMLDAAELVESLIPALLPKLRPPYAFFGHSLGALIAFETARALRARNYALPSYLFVGARHAPQWQSPASPIHNLPDDDFLAALKERFGGIPEAILREPELLARLLPTLRADVTLLERYRYQIQDPFPFPISAFGGAYDRAIGAEALEAWREQTSGSFRCRMIPGSHFFLIEQRPALHASMLEDLQSVLDRRSTLHSPGP
jgi:medium-chain acyl-[acyl-carrier-protein] hydrolase